MARKDNYWAGWSSYRYGSANKPTLPRILKGQKREHVVSRIFDILKGWQSSPFQNEGAARAGLRSALCLEGHRWAIADNEAASIVAEGLRLMGAEYPSWQEGQPGYATPAEDCQWCGREIDLEERTETGRWRFCSEVCARSALRYREFEDGWWNDNAGWAAYRVLMRERNPPRPCKQCGKAFHPLRQNDERNVYCSSRCQAEAMRVLPTRSCKHCGEEFRPRVSDALFCSKTCYDAFLSARTHTCICTFCGDEFQATVSTAQFCSKAHQLRARDVRRGIELMEKTGKLFRPRGPTAHHAQRMLDAYLAEKAEAGRPAPTTPTPVHLIHQILDAARRTPALHRPLTAAVFDQCFARAA